MSNNRGERVDTMTLEIASEPKLRPQLEMRLTGDWIGFTIHVPWAFGEPEVLVRWAQKAAAIASAQEIAASLRRVVFAFSGPELPSTSDLQIEGLVQLWVEAFAAAGCWPELREVARGRPAGVNGAQRIYETTARTGSEFRESLTPTASESGVSERLYGHAQNSGTWLRALSAPGSASTSTSPTPAPKQPVLASVLPTPIASQTRSQGRSTAKRSETEMLVGLVRKYIQVYGAAPDFVSDKPAAVEKAHNYIRSTTARPNLSEDELERVRHTLAKK